MPNDLHNLCVPASQAEIKARHAQEEHILRALDSKDANAVAQAIRQCQSLPAYQVASLINTATSREVWLFNLQKRRLFSVLLIIATLFTFLLACSISSADSANLIILDLIFAMLFGPLIFAKRSKYRTSHRAITNLAKAIENTQDPAMLPEAMRLLLTKYRFLPEDVIAKGLYSAASRLMLTLSTKEIRAFGIQQQAFYLFLYGTCWQSNPNLSLCILEFLEESGTSSATPVVLAIAHNLRTPKHLQSVVQAAQSCLEALKQREKEAAQPETLLRAASAPASLASVLLRSVNVTDANIKPDSLLRSAAHMAGEPTQSGKMVSEDYAPVEVTS